MVGTELLAHVQGMRLAAGAALTAPKEPIATDAVGARLAADIGLHSSYAAIKRSNEPASPPAEDSSAE